jgi:membrane associated rhomboid family serine protease
LPKSTRWFLVGYFLLFPIALAGSHLHLFSLAYAMALSPDQVWKGQVWRLVTYAFLPSCLINWLVSTFWLATLVSLLKNDWTPRRMLGYSLLGALGGAVPVVLDWQGSLLANEAVIFALLVAWVWFHGRESVLLLGIGELTARQAAILVAAIVSLVLFIGAGLFLTVAMWCGGVAGWLWLALRSKMLMGRNSQVARSERITRLEL